MKVRHWSLFWAIRIQSRPSSSCILSCNAYMCLACRLVRSGSPTKILYVFVVSPMRTTHPIHLTLLPPSKVRYYSQHPVLKPHVSCTPMPQGVMQTFTVDATHNFRNCKEENITFHRTEKKQKDMSLRTHDSPWMCMSGNTGDNLWLSSLQRSYGLRVGVSGKICAVNENVGDKKLRTV